MPFTDHALTPLPAIMRPLFAHWAQYYGVTITPCGSRATVFPPPMDTDQDYLFYIPSKLQAKLFIEARLAEGWRTTSEYPDASPHFVSLKYDELNLIVTTNGEWARRHQTSTALLARLNLKDKQDRIAVSHAVLYGSLPDGNKVLSS